MYDIRREGAIVSEGRGIKMRNVYPVYFTKTNDNVLVEDPDLDILTEGKDMNDAIDMARDAIELACVSMEDAKEEIPNTSDISELNVDSGTFADEGKTIISFVDIDSTEYRKKVDFNGDLLWN